MKTGIPSLFSGLFVIVIYFFLRLIPHSRLKAELAKQFAAIFLFLAAKTKKDFRFKCPFGIHRTPIKIKFSEVIGARNFEPLSN